MATRIRPDEREPLEAALVAIGELSRIENDATLLLAQGERNAALQRITGAAYSARLAELTGALQQFDDSRVSVEPNGMEAGDSAA